jgi:hypothetical protein
MKDHHDVITLPRGDAAELAEFKRQIRSLYDMKEAAVGAGNPDPIVNRFYVDNAMTFGPDAKVMQGRKQFRAHYQSFFEGFTSAKIRSVHCYVNGNSGWDWADFIATARDGNVVHAAMLFLWVRIDGQWACAGDTYGISGAGRVNWPA